MGDRSQRNSPTYIPGPCDDHPVLWVSSVLRLSSSRHSQLPSQETPPEAIAGSLPHRLHSLPVPIHLSERQNGNEQVAANSGPKPGAEPELLSIDIVEPGDFMVRGDVTLSVELRDDSPWSETILASVELSALR